MKKKEKELFRSLCSFQSEDFDESLLVYATPSVLGHLFFNRMQGVAYGTLKKHGLLGKINREFRNSLRAAFDQNVQKNESFFWCLKHLESILKECRCPYAMLKGAYLCKEYPVGYRTSNDVDILLAPKDVTELGNALLQAGFRQGHIRGGIFEPASRMEIIESKMMRGETVPYILKIDRLGMGFLEVDVNFSLEYKPGDTHLLEEMMRNTVIVEREGLRVPTLRKDDFLIHLCCHLYKEATTLPWVEMMRDMTLYKYCDIYMLMNCMPKESTEGLFARAKEMGVEKICAFGVLQTAQLFDFHNIYAVQASQKILERDPVFLHTVVSPRERKTYVYFQKDIQKRLFANDRKALLREVGTV